MSIGEVMRIAKLKSEYTSSPAQFRAETLDGRGVYVRYRWGHLEMWVATPGQDDALDGEMVLNEKFTTDADGDPQNLNGCMSVAGAVAALAKFGIEVVDGLA